MTLPMELGLYTFGDRTPDPFTGIAVSAGERMRQILEIGTLSDRLGLDIMGVGEHHALMYVNSATATMIAALAAVTKRLRLTSASTSISTADPVRTFQEFATADLVSEGRVELIFGRGAFTDNFPLFGFDLANYDALFIEKVELFAQLNTSERVTWSGKFRPPLNNAEISPRPFQSKLPVWIGALSPSSVARAAMLGYPVALPMLGGTIDRYAQLAAFYRRAWLEAGRPADEIRIAVFSHLHVSDTEKELERDFFPYYSAYLEPLFKGPMPRGAFEQMVSREGTLVAGTLEQVSEKLTRIGKQLGNVRYLGQIDIGGQPFDRVMHGIELFATRVAPVVRHGFAGLRNRDSAGPSSSEQRN